MAKHHKTPTATIDTTGVTLSAELVDNPVGYYQRVAISGAGVPANPAAGLGYAIKCDSTFITAGLPDASGALGPVYFDFAGPETTTAHLWEQTVDGWIDTGVSCPVVVP